MNDHSEDFLTITISQTGTEYLVLYKHLESLPESWTCHMCAALNNISIPSKVYKNLEDFWGERSDCATKERRIRKLVEKMD